MAPFCGPLTVWGSQGLLAGVIRPTRVFRIVWSGRMFVQNLLSHITIVLPPNLAVVQCAETSGSTQRWTTFKETETNPTAQCENIDCGFSAAFRDKWTKQLSAPVKRGDTPMVADKPSGADPCCPSKERLQQPNNVPEPGFKHSTVSPRPLPTWDSYKEREVVQTFPAPRERDRPPNL